jgi:hypothetical protein
VGWRKEEDAVRSGVICGYEAADILIVSYKEGVEDGI